MHRRQRKVTHNRRLAKWRGMWINEHYASHQLLWCIDSFGSEIRRCVKRQNVGRHEKNDTANEIHFNNNWIFTFIYFLRTD